MDIIDIPGWTRRLGEEQGYLPLPVRDIVLQLEMQTGDGRLPPQTRSVPAMLSWWRPSPEELAILCTGGAIQLRVLGTTPPPMRIDAVPGAGTPESSLLKALRDVLYEHQTLLSAYNNLRQSQSLFKLDPEPEVLNARAVVQAHDQAAAEVNHG